MTSPSTPVATGLITIGAPLLAISALALNQGAVVGSAWTVWATILAGVLVPTFSRFFGVYFLKACKVPPDSSTAYIFFAVCNMGIGAASALLFMPYV